MLLEDSIRAREGKVDLEFERWVLGIGAVVS